MLPLLLAALPAGATDLDLTIAAFEAEPVSLTFRDVEPGPLPAIVLPGAEGTGYRFSFELTDEGDDLYVLAIRLETVGEPRRGREAVEVLSNARIRVRADETARLAQGTRQRDPATGEVVSRFSVEAEVRTGE